MHARSEMFVSSFVPAPHADLVHSLSVHGTEDTCQCRPLPSSHRKGMLALRVIQANQVSIRVHLAARSQVFDALRQYVGKLRVSFLHLAPCHRVHITLAAKDLQG